MTTEGKKGKVLVTGGAGYIGSTVCSALLDNGWTPIILDNLCQGPRTFVDGRIFYEGDISDRKLITRIFRENGPIHAAIHCAALIVVPESVEKPEIYYRENVCKSVELFSALRDLGCMRVVFSSSAAIYGVVDGFMVNEQSLIEPGSPYARSKLMMEMILRDYCEAYGMKGLALRYFNPIGADPKLRTGPYIKNPSHVLGRMVAVVQGRVPQFEITGTAWPTRDGTGIRDFIHVWDLALAHVKAVENFGNAFLQNENRQKDCFKVINLGTGKGVTVRELVASFERVTKTTLNKIETSPRPGDIAGSFANADTAKKLIDWEAKLSIDEGIQSAINWSKKYF